MKKKIIFGMILCAIMIFIFIYITRPNTGNYFNNKVTLNEKELNIKIDASNKTVESVQEELQNSIQNLTFIIQLGNNKEEFELKDLVQINIRNSLQEAKKINETYWGFEKLKEHQLDITVDFTVNEIAILEKISNSPIFINMEKSQDAYLEKTSDGIKIIPEIYGNEIDIKIVAKLIVENLNNKNLYLNLDELDMYIKPKILSTDDELVKQAEIFNEMINRTVEYHFGDKIEVVPKETLCEWLLLDNGELIFDEEAILSYIKKLANTYNTFGTNRKFTTTNGQTIILPAGDYGWSISQTKEVETLIEELKSGKNVSREPIWLYTGYGDYINNDGSDIGNSYVEISIPDQKLWLYIEGNLVLTSELVSGLESNGNGTPSGVFGITYKTRNAVLRGRDYASPVKYWMPFNGNIGMHDASWRSSFGGNIYKTSGSHGCINLPTENAEIIYKYMETFFPIIVYRQEELDKAE